MAFTRAQFRDEIRRRLGWSASDTFAVDAELDNDIDGSLAELHSLLVTIFRPGSWGVTAEPIPIIVGTGTYLLNASAFSRLIAVRMLYNNKLQALRTFDVITEDFDSNNRTWTPDTVRYALQMSAAGPILVFSPTPANVPSLVLAYYVTAPPILTGVETSWMGFDEYVVLDCVAKCLRKEEADARPAEAAKDAYITRIRMQAEPLDIGQVATVTDGRSLEERGGIDNDRNMSWFHR